MAIIEPQPRELAPSVDLWNTLSQSIAAEITIARRVKGQLWVACRPSEVIADRRIMGMSPQGYSILSLAAQGITNKAIAETLDISVGGVKGSLRRIHSILGSDSDVPTAASFIPIEATELDKLSPKINGQGAFVPEALTPSENTVFTLIGQGLTRRQIIFDRHFSESAHQTHLTSIYEKLGITGNRDSIKKAVILRRLAGALPNLQFYQAIESNISGQVADLLQDIKDNTDINLTPQGVVHVSTSKSQLLEELEAGQYVPVETVKHGFLSLEGLMAAILINRPWNGLIMRIPSVQPVIRDLIRREINQLPDQIENPHLQLVSV